MRAFASKSIYVQPLASGQTGRARSDGIATFGRISRWRSRNTPAGKPPTILYTGRLIPEKRFGLLIDAFTLARQERPDLRPWIVGQGPEHEALTDRIKAHDLTAVAELSGFVSEGQLDQWMAEATMIFQPSEREGYGMVVVEAAVRGVPTIVVEGADNAALGWLRRIAMPWSARRYRRR